jgi:hypothetical protein
VYVLFFISKSHLESMKSYGFAFDFNIVYIQKD